MEKDEVDIEGFKRELEGALKMLQEPYFGMWSWCLMLKQKLQTINKYSKELGAIKDEPTSS